VNPLSTALRKSSVAEVPSSFGLPWTAGSTLGALLLLLLLSAGSVSGLS
jgi:hypothetical protein